MWVLDRYALNDQVNFYSGGQGALLAECVATVRSNMCDDSDRSDGEAVVRVCGSEDVMWESSVSLETAYEREVTRLELGPSSWKTALLLGQSWTAAGDDG